MTKFNRKKEFVLKAIDFLNNKYGEGTFVAEINDSYYNMYEKVRKHPHLLDSARRAFESVGVKPVSVLIRGGTDGAKLSFEGLPCPNLSAGGSHCHSRTEFVPIESLEKMSEVIVALARIYADFKK
jgi:tripeptide aminopeptidase